MTELDLQGFQGLAGVVPFANGTCSPKIGIELSLLKMAMIAVALGVFDFSVNTYLALWHYCFASYLCRLERAPQ